MKHIAFITCLLHFCILIFAQRITVKNVGFIKDSFVFKKVGSTELYADVYRTRDTRVLKPAIIWMHGGALMFGSRADIPEEQVRLYLAAGYTLIAIDYRLAPETKLPGIISDATEAVEWTRTNGKNLLGIDSANVIVVGQSAGAYLALLSGYMMKHPPKAIVSFYGYGDIRSEWYNQPDSAALSKTIITDERAGQLVGDATITSAQVKDRLDLYIFSRQKGIWPKLVSGYDPKDKPEWFVQYCPVDHINRQYPPVLLIHGEKDADVPLEASVLLDEALTKANVQHHFIRLKNYGHLFDIFEGGLSNPDVNRVFSEVVNFMNSQKEK